MSKEIKEKCKMCCYYNDKQQYPYVEGQTTHSNCISIKCQYRKITKDMQIRNLTNKVADLEAKLAESEEKAERYEKWSEYVENRFSQLKQQLAQKEKLIEFYINSGKELCEEINKLNRRVSNYCDAIDNHNQDKIELLETIYKDFNRKIDDEFSDNDVKYITLDIEEVNFYLMDKLKEIKGE